MEPDREDRSAASAGLRDAGLSHAGFRDGGLSDAWRLRSLATGWLTADDWHSEDPLSGLATLPYLRTRLAEVYREAEQGGTSPADTHRLLVVRLPGAPQPVAPDGPGHRCRP